MQGETGSVLGPPPDEPAARGLADEMTAFANAAGGVLLCGVSDSGVIQGMSPKQMAALDRLLVARLRARSRYLRFDRHPLSSNIWDTRPIF